MNHISQMGKNDKITFGIVGGIGPLAGADLFFKFVKSTPAYKDSDHFNVILEQQPLKEDFQYAVKEYDPTKRKLHIFNIIRHLVERKANCIILSCFISHTFINELANSLEVPIINMMEGIKEFVSAKYPDAKNIGILTSDYLIKERLFEKYFPSGRYNLIYPDSDLQKNCLMEAVYGPEGIKAGRLSGQVIEFLKRVSLHLVEKGAELIIPGFTEIPVVYDSLADSRYAIVDVNQVYADWAIRRFSGSENKKHYTIGIIGGLGPSATVDLMDKIIKNTPGSKDQEHIRMIVEHDPKIPDRTAHLLNGEEDPTIPLYKCAKKLESEGADFVIIPCNTAHAFVDRIQRYLSIPIINMIDEVVAYIKDNYPQCSCAGLLATDGTIRTSLYQDAFYGTSIKLITPDIHHQRFVMDAIYGVRGIKAGFTEGEPERLLEKAILYLAEQGAKVIILGCTELPLVIKESESFCAASESLIILDPTNVLAKKSVSLVCGKC